MVSSKQDYNDLLNNFLGFGNPNRQVWNMPFNQEPLKVTQSTTWVVPIPPTIAGDKL